MGTKETYKTSNKFLLITTIKVLLSPLLGIIIGIIISRFLFHIDWYIILPTVSFIFGVLFGSIIGCLLAYIHIRKKGLQE